MKKQLLLLSLSLLLASCGGTSDASQEAGQSASESTVDSALVSTSETPSEAESSLPAEKTKAETLKDLFNKMAETGICTYTDPGLYSKHYLGGDKGMLYVLDPQQQVAGNPIGYGVSKLPNYGLVQYYYQNETAGVDASTLQIVSPNKALTFADYDNSVKDLGECGALVTFAESSRTHTFSTEDEDFLAALLTLDGMEDAIDLFPTKKATITLNDEGTEMTVGYILDGNSTYGKRTFSGMVISNVGTAKNTNVENFLKSNPTMTAPTAWDADTLTLFNSVSTGFALPFPTGATYAATMPLRRLSEDSPLITVFRDYGCGNKTTAYGSQLTAAGYTLDPENTDTANGIAGYTKVVTPASGLNGATSVLVLIHFQATTGEDARFYPNGIFSIYITMAREAATVTETQLNTYLSQFKLDWAPTTNVFPTLSFGTNCTKIEFEDQTEETQEYYDELFEGYPIVFDFEISAVVNAYYPSQANAETALANLALALTTAGFEELEQYPGSFTIDDPSGASDYTVEIDLEVAMTSTTTPTYAGYISVSLMYLSITM